MNLLRCCDLVEVPWKNGSGITREIATGNTGGRPAWRLSRADVIENGAFSNFAGLTRVLTVVSGGGMVLRYASGSIDAKLWKPVKFDGGLDISSHLVDGPLTDLNLMYDPSYCAGDVVIHRGPCALDIAPTDAGITALHVLAGTPDIAGTRLNIADTAFLDAPGQFNLSEGDAIIEIRLTYLPQSNDIKLCIATR